MKHIGRYLTILQNAKQIMDICEKTDDKEAFKNANWIYTTAFYELMKSGMPHENTGKEIFIETDGERYVMRAADAYARDIMQMTEDTPEKEPEKNAAPAEKPVKKKEKAEEAKEPVEAKGSAEDLEPYEVPLDAPDETLEDPVPDVTITAEEKSKKAAVKAKPVKQEQEPVETVTDTTEEPAEAPSKPAQKKEAPAPAKPEIKHYLAPDVPMLKKKDFTFDYVAAIIKSRESKKKVNAELVVAPLRIDIENPEIMVGLINGKKTTVVKSKGEKPAHILVGDYTAEISGRMQNGKFVSECKLAGDDEERATIDTKVTSFGDKGHVILNDEDSNTHVHILPVTFANNEKNNADIIYYVYADGDEILGGTDNSDSATFNSGGEKLELVSRWKGDTLYSMVKPSEE